jgi:hypothetical protein
MLGTPFLNFGRNMIVRASENCKTGACIIKLFTVVIFSVPQ